MRTSPMLAAAACLLAAPFSSPYAGAAECSGKVPRVALVDQGGRHDLVSPWGGEIQGMYALSNGRRLKLFNHYGSLVAVFDQRQLVRLEEVGANRYASREGDVELSWEPRQDVIRLNYPADGAGRLLRACEG